MEGVGLEDFEECERTFHKSNELASITRLATPFHRQQQIDEHFFFHDLDKHATSGEYFGSDKACFNNLLGKFIFQNYRQALEQIQTNGVRLRNLASQLGTTSEDYEAYLTSDRQYLQALRVEPPEIVEKADYIDHLTKLYRLQ